MHVFTAHVHPHPFRHLFPRFALPGAHTVFESLFSVLVFASFTVLLLPFVFVCSSIMFSHFLHCTQRFCRVSGCNSIVHSSLSKCPFLSVFFLCFARSQTITLVLITILKTQPYMCLRYFFIFRLFVSASLFHTLFLALQVQTPR